MKKCRKNAGEHLYYFLPKPREMWYTKLTVLYIAVKGTERSIMKKNLTYEDTRAALPAAGILHRIGTKFVPGLCIAGLVCTLTACGGSASATSASASAASSATSAAPAESVIAASASAESLSADTPSEPQKTEIVYASSSAFTDDEAQPASTPAAQPSAVSATDSIYASKIMETCQMILTFDAETTEVPAGAIGIIEIIAPLDTAEDRLGGVSYAIRDINADGTDELFFLAASSPYEDTQGDSRILAMYTVRDGQPVLVLEGWARNRCFLLKDGSIYREGSNGAAESIFGTYTFDASTSGIIPTDYYFSGYADENSYAISYYRNQTGSSNIEESSVVSGEVFAAVMQDFNEDIVTFDATSFSTFSGTDADADLYYAESPAVTVISGAEDIAEYGVFDEYTPETDGSGTRLMFVADSSVTDFRILALSFSGIAEDGIRFDGRKIYSQKELTSARPLATVLPLSETIPNYGISYKDESGTVHSFAVISSGYDGSVYLGEVSING